MHPAGTAIKATAGAGLTLGALGVVFGDIGTSPLYALRECLNYLPPDVAADYAARSAYKLRQ